MGSLISHATRLRLRRLFKRERRKTEDSVQLLSEQFDKHFITKFVRLKRVRRFTLSWLCLLILLIIATVMQTVGMSSAYQHKAPVSGGVYHEGIVGTFSTANPLYATGAVDVAISRLVFDSLLRFDDDNNLVGNLADSVDRDETGKVYTVHLKHKLMWQDGSPLTADDVVFTYNTIKNPDAHSPLLGSMRGVDVSKLDDMTVRFSLSSALVTFPNSLTIGLIPKHILESVPAQSLRTAEFNTMKPIGSGPFKWYQLSLDSVSTSTTAVIKLDRFDNYHAGTPKLERFVLHTFASEDDLEKAYKDRTVYAAAGLDSTEKIISSDKESKLYSFQSTAATMVFFNTSSNGALSDKNVRAGLMHATDRRTIVTKLGQALRVVREPVLISQFAFDPQYASSLYNLDKANSTLTAAGWQMHSDGYRYKDGKKLSFRLYGDETPDNAVILNELQRQWRAVGAAVEVVAQSSMYFQPTLQYRSYDAVIHSIDIGNDPDVYAYWHSSQADGNGMNFSNWKSKDADVSLEAGRTRQDDAQRKVKYKAFLKSWSEDTPAVPLFTPRFYYITRGPVYGLTEHVLNTDADRYYSAYKWMISAAMVDDH